VVPPDLAYGDAGQGDIAPGETLVFVIDLESSAPGSTSTPEAG
jgi:FKBP-type peptidyl-prolyl cis-trans isomerase